MSASDKISEIRQLTSKIWSMTNADCISIINILNEHANLLEAQEKAEPVAWQFLNHDGRWVNGSEHNRHYENTVEAGYQTRQLYPEPLTTPTSTNHQFPFEAACSGLRYESPEACGEVSAIYINGKRWPLSDLCKEKQAPVVDERKCQHEWTHKTDDEPYLACERCGIDYSDFEQARAKLSAPQQQPFSLLKASPVTYSANASDAPQECRHDWNFVCESSDHSSAEFQCQKCGKEETGQAPVLPDEMPNVCDGKEQEAFEKFAIGEKYDMKCHPLHYLFLDEKTYAARQAWKAAIEYCRAEMLKGEK